MTCLRLRPWFRDNREIYKALEPLAPAIGQSIEIVGIRNFDDDNHGEVKRLLVCRDHPRGPEPGAFGSHEVLTRHRINVL